MNKLDYDRMVNTHPELQFPPISHLTDVLIFMLNDWTVEEMVAFRAADIINRPGADVRPLFPSSGSPERSTRHD